MRFEGQSRQDGISNEGNKNLFAYSIQSHQLRTMQSLPWRLAWYMAASARVEIVQHIAFAQHGDALADGHAEALAIIGELQALYFTRCRRSAT